MFLANTRYSDAFGGCLKEDASPDFSLLGIPFDGKVSYRKGAANGPDAIRKTSTAQSIGSYTERGVDLIAETSIADLGNIIIDNNIGSFHDDITSHVSNIVKNKSIPVVLGGDHSITYPVVRGVWEYYKELNIVWIDAHPDIYDEYEGDKLSHACPLARIIELGGIQSIVQGGIRSLNPELIENLKKAGAMVYKAANFSELADLYLQGPTYLSIDIDVLDPAFAPGVGTPVPGGISTRELINTIHSFDFSVVGFDLVEVNPDYDVSSITSAAAAKIVMETIAQIVYLGK